MNTKIIVTIVIGVLIIGGGLFYFSTKPTSNDGRPSPTQIGQEGQMRGGQGAPSGMSNRPGAVDGRTIGEITSKDDTSITVKLFDGSSKIVLISSSTTINKMVAGTITAGSTTDLVVGENVIVIGATSADGDIDAESIQLVDAFQRPQGIPPVPAPVQ